MESIEDLLDVNEIQIKKIEKELFVLRAQIRKPISEALRKKCEDRIDELHWPYRKLLLTRKVLQNRLKKEPAKVIAFKPVATPTKRKKPSDVGARWVRLA